MNEIFEKLKKMVCNYVDVNPDDIHEDSKFVEDMDFNSYDLMCMVGEMEETFGVEIDERQAAKIVTVRDAMEYISALQK